MKAPEYFECPIPRGARVRVNETNIRAWEGDVLSVKWSRISGWWLEVRNEAGGTWAVPAGKAEVIPEIDGSGYARSGEGDWN